MSGRLSALLVAGLAAAGALLLALYAVAAFGVVDTGSEPRDAAGVAGLAFGALVAGALAGCARPARDGRPRVEHVRFPAPWVGVATFVLAVGGGFALIAWDEARGAEPFVALLASVALVAAIGALLVRWAPGRRANARDVLVPTAWGIAGATTLAVIAQLVFALGLAAGVFAGLAWHDASLPRELLERLRDEAFVREASEELLVTPTVMVAIVAVLAVAAPLTEELTKLLGVVLAYRQRAPDAYGAFLAGAFVGLGFAAIETLAVYSLPAGDGWATIMLLRAPVAIMHVTAAALAGYGWYLQRSRGGFALVRYYAAAVAVHALWNGAFVAMMLIALSSAGGDPERVSPAAALAVLMIAGGMLALLAGCLGWLVRTARRLGSSHVDELDRALPSVAGTPGITTLGRSPGLISR